MAYLCTPFGPAFDFSSSVETGARQLVIWDRSGFVPGIFRGDDIEKLTAALAANRRRATHHPNIVAARNGRLIVAVLAVELVLCSQVPRSPLL